MTGGDELWLLVDGYKITQALHAAVTLGAALLERAGLAFVSRNPTPSGFAVLEAAPV